MAHATTPLVTALSRAVRRDRRRLARAMEGARQGDVTGVHATRVACRRLRAAIPLAEAAGRDSRRADRALRRLMKTLGPIREADVAGAVLEEAARAADWSPAVVGRVDRAVRKQRDRLRASAHRVLEAFEMDELLADLEGLARAIEREASDIGAARALAARVRQRAAELVAAIDQAGTLYLAEPLHAVRLAAKKLRYALELAQAAPGGHVGPAQRRLRRAQVLLGGLHDLQTVQAAIQRVAARGGPARATLRTLGEMDRALEGRCRAAHAAFLRLAPGLRAVAARLARAVALGSLQPRPARMSHAAAGRPAGAAGGRR